MLIRSEFEQSKKLEQNKERNFRSNLKKSKNEKEENQEYINPVLNAQVFKIQKAMKKFYIKSKNLPENYFYVQKILKYQYDKRLKNYEDNVNYLFSVNGLLLETLENNLNKTFETERLNTKNKFYMTNNNYNSNNSNKIGTVFHNPYEDSKIHLFGKVLDIDIMVLNSIIIFLLLFIIFLE